MNIVKLSSGKIFFDEFEESQLDYKWQVIPNDISRYSTVEADSSLKIYHGDIDMFFLVDEPNFNYVVDVRNTYIPNDSNISAGIVVFKDSYSNLELLEYYDPLSSSVNVYEYLRIVKSNNIYTAYGKNYDNNSWELVGSGYFNSGGKIGLVIKGNCNSPPVFQVDFFRMYRSNFVQVINLPEGYSVHYIDANLNKVLDTRTVLNSYNGVIFSDDEIPPYKRYFKVYDKNKVLIHTSNIFDVTGGDLFYFGAVLNCYINGSKLYEAGEYFLGTFQNEVIEFDLKLENIHDIEFRNISIQAIPYNTNPGYDWVTFSEDSIKYLQVLPIDIVPPHSEMTIKGKITRDTTVTSSIEPFKFLIRVNYS